MKGSQKKQVRSCRVCGCTDDDCRQCIEKTGEPCWWIAADVCSACLCIIEVSAAELDAIAKLKMPATPEQYEAILGVPRTAKIVSATIHEIPLQVWHNQSLDSQWPK